MKTTQHVRELRIVLRLMLQFLPGTLVKKKKRLRLVIGDEVLHRLPAGSPTLNL